MNYNYETNIFSVQKSGNKEEENEDAYAIGKNGNLIAISDGASDSFSSRIWAQLLSQEFIDNPIDFNNKEVFLAWLESIQQKWLEKIDWEKLPWFSEEKAKVGDFASLLTLSISEERNRIISYAIGDSCLFIIRENKCLTFPIEKSNEFNNYP
ncbi:MAG: protein phosphatase 2C domain-containing protein, partial [Nitrososphaeraceae archaeon]